MHQYTIYNNNEYNLKNSKIICIIFLIRLRLKPKILIHL